MLATLSRKGLETQAHPENLTIFCSPSELNICGHWATSGMQLSEKVLRGADLQRTGNSGSSVRSADLHPPKMLQDARMAASSDRNAAFRMTGERQQRAGRVWSGDLSLQFWRVGFRRKAETQTFVRANGAETEAASQPFFS